MKTNTAPESNLPVEYVSEIAAVRTRIAGCALLIDRGDWIAARARLDEVLERIDEPKVSNALVVHIDGRWFQFRAGQRVDCARRPMLCAVVATLARARVESPGAPVSSETLIAAVWPGQRIPRRHAFNRLRVGIATLRKLGLRDVLRSVRGAYLFDPEVPVHPVHS
jgi:hypothetical protein